MKGKEGTKTMHSKKQNTTTAINAGYSLVLAVATIAVLGLFLVKDPDVTVEISVGLVLGALVSSILGSILKKSLIVTLLISTGILALAGLMILMQIDFSGF